MKKFEPDRILQSAFNDLQEAVNDRKSDFHLITLATVSEDGLPQLRKVVCRKFDPERRTILFNADFRSPKVRQIIANPNISMLFYDKKKKIQMRFKAFAHVHNQDDLTRARWQNTWHFSKRCYLTRYAPTSQVDEATDGVDKNIDTRHLSELHDEAGYKNFSCVVCNFSELDWLYLQAQGHTRAGFIWDEKGNMTSTWLSP